MISPQDCRSGCEKSDSEAARTRSNTSTGLYGQWSEWYQRASLVPTDHLDWYASEKRPSEFLLATILPDQDDSLQPPIEPKVDYLGDTQNFELFDDEPLQAPECSREESDRFDQFWLSRKSMWNKTLRSINILFATDSASKKNRDFLLYKHRVLSFFLTRTVCQTMHRLAELVVQRLRHPLFCQRQI